MDFNNLSNKELAVAKVKCEKSLLFFTRFFFRVLRGSKFIVNWHHEEMCHWLEETAKYVFKLLNINIPPRCSKTEIAGINFIAQSLAINPKANFLYITSSDELRSETSIRIRDIVTHPYYKRMFNVELKKDQTGKNLWRTSQGGGLKTATIFGQITGFGAGRMVESDKDLINFIKDFEGAIIMDDINKIIDSESDNASNKKAIDTIFSTILSRVNSKETPLVNIQQRTGLNDATEALLDYFDSEQTKNIVLPVVIDNKPLWPYKYDWTEIDKLRTHYKTAHIFETQYMQNPIPSEGLLLPKSELNYFKLTDLLEFDKKEISPDTKWSTIDTADEGDDNFCNTFGYHYGKYIYIVDVIYDKRTFEFTEPRTIELTKFHKVDRINYESNKEGTLFKRMLKREFPDIYIKGVRNMAKKIVRIKNQTLFIKKYMLFRNDYTLGSDYDRFVKDIFALLSDGSNKDHDDAPDNLATYAKQVQKAYPELYE